MQKPRINPKLVEQKIQELVCCGPLNELQERIKETALGVAYEHDLVVRHYCVALANIALAIIKKAPDTIWLTDTETVVEYIASELGIEHENIEQSLEEFVAFQPRDKRLWEKQWEDRNAGTKLEKQDQLDLLPQSKS